MKYELDTSTATYFETPTQSHTLCRIKALKDFADIKAGTYGGYIEDYKNLSHDGNCWVYDNAKVIGSAHIKDNAKIKNEAIISGQATLNDYAIVKDKAVVTDHTIIENYATVEDHATIKQYAVIGDKATIKGNVTIDGSAQITSNAIVASDYDYMVIKNPYDKTMTYTNSNKRWTINSFNTNSNKRWTINSFNGTSKELIAHGYEHSQSKGQTYEQCVDFVTKQLNIQAIENPKYELLSDDTVTVNRVTLRRIHALRDFGTVKAGTLGGYIESENNLRHNDNAWIHDDAKIFGDALITDNAHIYGNVIVKDKALVKDDAFITGNVIIQDQAIVSESPVIRDHARIYNKALVYGHALIQDHANVSGNAHIYENATIAGTSQVTENAHVYDKAVLRGNTIVIGHAKIKDDAVLSDHVRISEYAVIARNANLCNNVHVSGFANVTATLDGNETITGDAIVDSANDVFCVKLKDTNDNSHFPENKYITYTKSNDMWHHSKFYGTSRKLLRSAKTTDQRRFYKQLLKLVGKHLLFL